MLKTPYFIIFFFSILFTMSAYSKPQDKIIVDIENYLTSIKTIQSTFTQINPDNQIRKGSIFVDKPDRMRVEYYTPSKELILLNSDLIMHYDFDLDETNYINKEDFLLDILSSNNFRITKHCKVKSVNYNNNQAQISFYLKNDKEKRLISMIFKLNPITLKSIIIDHGNNITRIEFGKLISGEPLDDILFNFNYKRFQQ